jgi:hypothetical protein
VKRSPALTFLIAAAAALFASGCRPDIEDVCDTIADACSDTVYQECLDDAKALEIKAMVNDCEDAFDDYLGCVAEPVCQWEDACAAPRATLEACIGEFPP